MTADRVELSNIKGFEFLAVDFNFPSSNIIVITGKNGAGKTSIVKAFSLISDPKIFEKSASLNSIRRDSKASFIINGKPPFTFHYNEKLKVLDSRDSLPENNEVIAELPLPFGRRFESFSLISSYDNEIRTNIASSKYRSATELMAFLDNVYIDKPSKNLKSTNVKRNIFYFILLDDDYYIREDHLSSGEYFLIQLFRLITSGAKLILIDELDIALDASAQVNLYQSIKPILENYKSRLIVISHSLAFMSTVEEGGLYYLEKTSSHTILEQRSFGYIKSDLYGFRGKDRFIITEDIVLSGFLKFLIRSNITTFFEYEIIAVGGQPQIDAMAMRNDSHQIFGAPHTLAIFIDNDIANQIRYNGPSIVLTSPVEDLELYIWKNRQRLLAEINQPIFTHADKEKKTAKTYWRKVIGSRQKSVDDLYQLVVDDHKNEVDKLIIALKKHLCMV